MASPRRPAPPLPIPRERLAYLDNLKVLLVAVIIAAHGFAGYSGFEGAWPYQPHREVRLSGVSNDVLGMLVLPSMVFAMGLFFLISGLVTPGSLQRKGPRRFARDRVVRLGIPLAIVVLGIWPALVYLGNRVGGDNASYWTQFMHANPFLDPGPMWFVEVLLIYSLAYAAWRGWRQHYAPRPRRSADRRASLSGRTLVLLAAGISLTTIPMRFVFPWDSHQVAELQLWQWPQYLAMFGLGIVAAQRGWLDVVPDQIRRRFRTAALVGVFAVLTLILGVVAAGLDPGDAFSDLRLHWAPIGPGGDRGPARSRRIGVAARHRATASQRPADPSRPRARSQRVRCVHPPGTRADRPCPRPAPSRPARRDQSAPCRLSRRGRLVRAGVGAHQPHPAEPHPLIAHPHRANDAPPAATPVPTMSCGRRALPDWPASAPLCLCGRGCDWSAAVAKNWVGAGLTPAPPTPPDVRVRIRRFAQHSRKRR